MKPPEDTLAHIREFVEAELKRQEMVNDPRHAAFDSGYTYGLTMVLYILDSADVPETTNDKP